MTEGLTQWLERLDSGDPEALDRVVRLLYDELRGLAGRVQVPFLRDANTGAAMLESADIVAYLEREYARA